MMMPRKESPKLGPGGLKWDEWVSDHFTLADASGNRVPLRRSNFSRLIGEPTAGTPEFFLIGVVKPGTRYTLDYLPVRSEFTFYRYAFTAPSAAVAAARFTANGRQRAHDQSSPATC